MAATTIRSSVPREGIAAPDVTRTCSCSDRAFESVCGWTRPAGVSARFDKGLRKTHRFGVGERLIEFRERVRARANGPPGDGRVMPFEHAQRANEMRDLAAPAAPNLEMLLVDLLVHVDRAWPRV